MGKILTSTDKKGATQNLKELKTKTSRLIWLNCYLNEDDKKYLITSLENITTLLAKLEKYETKKD
jgi:hypothetical protein